MYTDAFMHLFVETVAACIRRLLSYASYRMINSFSAGTRWPSARSQSRATAGSIKSCIWPPLSVTISLQLSQSFAVMAGAAQLRWKYFKDLLHSDWFVRWVRLCRWRKYNCAVCNLHSCEMQIFCRQRASGVHPILSFLSCLATIFTRPTCTHTVRAA